MFAELWRRILFIFDRERRLRELEEEMQLHRERRSAEEITVTSRGFGNTTRWMEISREVWVTGRVDAFIQDMRFALRQCVRNRGVTLTIVVSLALGLGATLAMFSLLNALLFKALPVPDPQQLVNVSHGSDNDHGPAMSYPKFLSLRRQSRRLAELFAATGSRDQLRYGSLDEKVDVHIVSGNFYSALRVNAQLGRLLEPVDDQKGSPSANAVVLSDHFWREKLQADPHIVGRPILLDGVPFIVAGVAPHGFFGVWPGIDPDLTITFAAMLLLNPKDVRLDCWDCNSAQVIGRLKPDVSLAQAQSGMRVIWQNLIRESAPKNQPEHFNNASSPDQLFLDPGGSGADSGLRFSFGEPLYILLGMSSLMLLAACSNVANLLLARAQARQRELAVRFSTGASRRRIVQQFLTESGMLALLGLAAGCGVYVACVRGLLWFVAQGGYSVVLDIMPDLHLLLFAVALTGATILAFGLWPAIGAGNAPLRNPLAESSHNIAKRSKSGRALVAVQMALSFILLTGAILLARSLYELRNIDLGFRRDHLLVASPDVTKLMPDAQDQARFADRILSRITGLSEVHSASVSTLLPGGGAGWLGHWGAEGHNSASSQENFVSPGFFITMGTPLLLGRDFAPRDEQPGAPAVAIVSQSFARYFWGHDDPLGKRIRDAEAPKDKPALTVIGVVSDAKHLSFYRPAPRTVYLPFPAPMMNGFSWGFHLEVWTRTRPETLMQTVRQIFKQQDSRIPVEIHTFDVLLDRRLIYQRLLAAIALGYAAAGAFLAAIGAYGVAAYAVSKRTFEAGIRTALGATRPQIIGLFAREHVIAGLSGLAAGLFGARSLTGFLQSWLFGVSGNDPLTLSSCAALLFVISAVAVLVPAVRAVRADAWQALRSE